MNYTRYAKHPNPPITNRTVLVGVLCAMAFVLFPPGGIFLAPIPFIMHKNHRRSMHEANAAARRRAADRARQTRILALKSLP
jgi:hypothetical protein